jgi:hypothetical protein
MALLIALGGCTVELDSTTQQSPLLDQPNDGGSSPYGSGYYSPEGPGFCGGPSYKMVTSPSGEQYLMEIPVECDPMEFYTGYPPEDEFSFEEDLGAIELEE